ncbi:WD domain, G-beta repeat protein [Teladorsagia circumcincta]|uniref:WD domain, G-beta repeat protein n=1 Tax=Teladorsagia circumcincta TaxID=45464 RepID=A0A2G9UPN0_TELCI|nr:WD domain, G-beta repeat protein [Teladorsagia circumcincta]
MALCQFDFIDSAVRTCSMVHLLSMYEECAMQVLHHDIQVLCEQVLIPAIPTVLRDREQLAAEDWKAGQTVLAPTFNHQHVLISGNQSAVGVIYMYHIAAQSLMTTFNGSGDFIVQMWSLETGRCISRMGGLMAPVSCIAITSNDAFVIVACEDETLRVFSTVAAQELHELMGHEGRVNALACAQDDCQLFAATKSIVYCYDIHNGQIVDVLDCQLPFPVFNIKISSDNFFLFSGCGPRVDVWHIQKRVHDAPDASGHMGFVTAIALSGDDKVPQSKGIPVSCLAFSFNQTFLLSGNTIGSVSVFDCSSGTLHRTFSVMMTQGVAPPIFAPPNGKLVVGHCPKNSKELCQALWQEGSYLTIQAQATNRASFGKSIPAISHSERRWLAGELVDRKREPAVVIQRSSAHSSSPQLPRRKQVSKFKNYEQTADSKS